MYLCLLCFTTVPERPADIKAVPAGANSIFVAWKPPLHANGDLLKYTLYSRDITDDKVNTHYTAEISLMTR